MTKVLECRIKETIEGLGRKTTRNSGGAGLGFNNQNTIGIVLKMG